MPAHTTYVEEEDDEVLEAAAEIFDKRCHWPPDMVYLLDCFEGALKRRDSDGAFEAMRLYLNARRGGISAPRLGDRRYAELVKTFLERCDE